MRFERHLRVPRAQPIDASTGKKRSRKNLDEIGVFSLSTQNSSAFAALDSD